MTLHISDIKLPENPVVGAELRIPVTVTNDTDDEVEVRVYLYSEKQEGGGSVLWDYEPDVHWQNIAAGDEYSFSGYWDTLVCTLPNKDPWNFWVELREQHQGFIEKKEFTLQAQDRPYWWGTLVDNIMMGNVKSITEPVMALFAIDEIEGITAPPFTCWICGDKFEGESATLDFGKHLMQHFTAFVTDWFKPEEGEES